MAVSPLDEPQDEAGAAAAVEMSAAARAWLVPVVRSLAAQLAARADFDLDFVADLAMAVDEVCATLVTQADTDGLLSCRFLMTSTRMEVQVRVLPRERLARVDTAGFGWRVLVCLVDELYTLSPADGGDQLEIGFVKWHAPR